MAKGPLESLPNPLTPTRLVMRGMPPGDRVRRLQTRNAQFRHDVFYATELEAHQVVEVIGAETELVHLVAADHPGVGDHGLVSRGVVGGAVLRPALVQHGLFGLAVAAEPL